MSKTILIVESDPMLSATLRQALEARGFTVQETTDGKGSFELIRRERPVLVVLAVDLTKEQYGYGYLICGKIKKDDDLKTTPVVIIGQPDGFAQHRKLKAHADAYVAEPVNPDELVEQVGGLIGFPKMPPAKSRDDSFTTIIDDIEGLVMESDLREDIEDIAQRNLALRANTAPANSKLPPLSLWTYGKQFKGSAAFKRMVEAYRDVVQAALPGISRSDLLEELGDQEEFKSLSLSSRRRLVARVAGLGLMEEREGLLRPTQDGLAFLENDLPDVLVHRMLERVFPMAAILRFLRDNPRPSGQIISYQQEIYPSWTGPIEPTSNLAWMRALALVERQPQDGQYRLSTYGAAWEARLPRKLPFRPVKLKDPRLWDDEEDVAEGVAPNSNKAAPPIWPKLPTLRQRILEDPQARRFVLDDSQFAALHHAWHCNPQKRFVILSGLSGTGKTALIQHYARVYCESMGLEHRKHLEVVAVSPDWKDPTGLLGYYNALHEVPSFQVEPALRLLLEAARNPSKPYFLLLDEMNLARVEQYFAPFLSSMESGLPIALHGQDAPVNGVPPRLEWPLNLFIAGTVNMDETTFPFSDKVLDRAFTLEFWDVDLPTFFKSRSVKRQPELENAIQAFYDALRPIRRHFGYRTAGELLAFVEAAGAEAPRQERQGLLDQGVFSKVLPRLRGEASPELRSAFTALRKLCEEQSLKRCGEKLSLMEASLLRVGVTRFWA